MSNLFLISMMDVNKWEPKQIQVPARVGRTEEASCRIDEESVSGMHAELFFAWEKYWVEDLGSTNGTRVNGERVQKQALADGDMLSFGNRLFLVRITDALPRLFLPESQRTIALGIMPFSIGRQSANQLALTEPGISGKHTVLYQENDAYFVKDQKSTNGTRINGHRVQTARIQDGDTLFVAKWKAIFLLQVEKSQKYCLRCLAGVKKGETWDVKERFSIGRNEDNDISVPIASMSANHAVLYWNQGRFWIKDLESKNGVRLRGIKIGEAPLDHGDEILLGKESFLFFSPDLPQEKYSLVLLSGERGGEEITLDKPKMVLGRSKDCPISLDAKGISQHHAEIEAKDGVFTLRDLKSKNGTYVQGEKIESRVLQHGDEIQIGMQDLIFRSSSLARPKSLQEESFVLLPCSGKGYKQPFVLADKCSLGSHKDNDIVLSDAGVSPKHAILLREENRYTLYDQDTSLGTRVNGEKITKSILSHGDEITIGKQRYIFKSSLRPLRREKVETLPPWFTFVAIAAVVLLFLSFLASLFLGKSPAETKTSPDEVKVVEKNDFRQPTDDERMQEAKIKVDEYVAQYEYEQAVMEIQKCYKALQKFDSRKKWENETAFVQERYRIFHSFIDFIKNRPESILLSLEGGKAFLQQINEKELAFLAEETKNAFTLAWKDLKEEHWATLLNQTHFLEYKPYDALMIAFWHAPQEVQKCLLYAYAQNPDAEQKKKLDNCYGEWAKLPVPEGGFFLYENRIITADEKAVLQSQAKEQEEKNKALLAQEEEKTKIREAEAAKQIALQNEEKEFSLRYAIIDEFVKTYSYQKAIEKFTSFAEELQSQELRKKVQSRIRQIEPMAKLFQKLLTAINQKTLQDDEIEIGKDFKVKIASATEEQFKVTLPQGESRFKWYSLPPSQLYQFFQRVQLDPKDLYTLGVFCFENNLRREGNETFIRLLSIAPQSKNAIDRYLAGVLDIPVPKEGFIPHNGVLVSADEKEKRLAGLLKYRGSWVTPETKEKMESGAILFQGKWMKPDEKKLLQRGYVQYKNKWYTLEDLEQVRSKWEDAWTASTEHYEIQSNVGSKFINELSLFMEGAYKEYERFFERKGKTRMTIYAFKTYEDYRRYCNDNGHSAQLRAGGFATNKNWTGVAWMRDNTKNLLETVIHEGSHLYHYVSCPALRPPSWYAEAVATQFEGYDWDGTKLEVHGLSPARLSWLKRKFLAKQNIPLDKMMQGDAVEYINRDPEDAATFYAQAWGLYYYLSRASEKNYQSHFKKFVLKMNNGQYAGREQNAFWQEFEQDLVPIEGSWKKYILHMK